MSFVHETTPAAKKRYQCFYCGEDIQPKEKYLRRVGSNGGDFFSMRAHPECADKATVESWTDDDYEYHEPGHEFKRPNKKHHEQDHTSTRP